MGIGWGAGAGGMPFSVWAYSQTTQEMNSDRAIPLDAAASIRAFLWAPDTLMVMKCPELGCLDFFGLRPIALNQSDDVFGQGHIVGRSLRHQFLLEFGIHS